MCELIAGAPGEAHAAKGDDVTDPAETRSVLVRSPAMPRDKHTDLPVRKHGNHPQ